MPAWLTATPDQLFSADNLYGRFAGVQKIANMAVIPAHDNSEMYSYIDKLVAWEADLDESGLTQLTADNDDAAGLFTEDSNSLKSLLPAGNLSSPDIYLKDIFADGKNIDDARAALFSVLNDGGVHICELPRSWRHGQVNA